MADQFYFDINSIEDYLEVGITPEEVKRIIENTPIEKIKPAYVSSYFICKPPRDLVIKTLAVISILAFF